MATGFNVVARLKLQAPTNIRPIVSSINRQLSGITAKVNIQINPNTIRNLTTVNYRLKDISTNLKSVATNARSAEVAIANLGIAFSAANGDIAKVAANLKTVQSATKTVTGGLKQSKTAVENLAEQIGVAAQKFITFSVAAGSIIAVTAAFKSGLDNFLKFQDQLVKIQQVSGKTKEEVASLGSFIGKLAVETGTSATKLSEAATDYAQAGLNIKETQEALRVTSLANLSPSFGDTTKTVKGLIAARSQFKLTADEYGKALGSIAAISDAYATDADALIENIKRAGGAFTASNGPIKDNIASLTELSAVFTVIQDKTQEAPEAVARGLRTTFSRARRPQVLDQLREFGIELEDSKRQFIGVVPAITQIGKALETLPSTDVRYARIVDILGGSEQFSRVLPLLQNYAKIQEVYNVGLAGQNKLTENAALANQSLLVQLSKVKEEFFEFTRTLGNSTAFQGAITAIIELTRFLIKLGEALSFVAPLLLSFAAFKAGSVLKGVATAGASIAKGFTNYSGPPLTRAKGGPVPGTGNTDSVHALLTPGEFVIPARAAKNYGYGNLERIRKYASGGRVYSGNVANVADSLLARQNQAVSSGNSAELQAAKAELQSLVRGVNDIVAQKFAALDFDPAADAVAKTIDKSIQEIFSDTTAKSKFDKSGSVIDLTIKDLDSKLKELETTFSVGSQRIKGSGFFDKVAGSRVGRFAKSGLGQAAIGIGVGAGANYLSNNVLGTAENPGSFGRRGAQAGAGLSGAASFGASGAAIGSLFGPLGTAVGALTGGLYGLIKGLDSFDASLAKVRENQRRNFVESGIQKNQGERLFSTNSEQGIFNKTFSGSQRAKDAQSGRVLGVVSDAGVKSRAKEVADIFDKLAKARPDASFKELAAVVDREITPVIRGGTKAGTVLKASDLASANQRNTINEAASGVLSARADAADQASSAKALQDKINAANKAFADLADNASNFADVLDLASRRFNERSDTAIGTFGNAFRGQISAGNTSRLNVGALGGEGVRARNFATTGGGFDQARSAIKDSLVEAFKGTALDNKNQDQGSNFEAIAGDKLKKIFGADSGVTNALIGRARGTLGTEGADISQQIKSGGLEKVVDEIVQPLQEIRDKTIEANKTLVQFFDTIGAQRNNFQTQRNQIRDNRTESAVTAQQNQAGFAARARDLGTGRVSSANFGRNGFSQGLGRLTNGGRVSQIISPEQLNARAETETALQGLRTRGNAVGLSNREALSPDAIRNRLRQNVVSTQDVQSRINNITQQPGGQNRLQEISGLQGELTRLTSEAAGFGQQLKNLSDSTQLLSAAQKELAIAEQKTNADRESRQGVGRLLAFGGGKDQRQFAQNEQLFQGVASGRVGLNQLNERQLSDLESHAGQTAGLQRQVFQGTDRRGRAKFASVSGQDFLNQASNEALARNGIAPGNATLQQNERAAQTRLRGVQTLQGRAGETINQVAEGTLNQQEVDFAKNITQAFQEFTASLQDLQLKDFVDSTALFNQGAAGIGLAMNTFSAQTQAFSQAVAQIPTSIAIEQNGKIEVIINGAETVARISGPLRDEIAAQIMTQVQEQLPRLLKGVPA